MKTKYKLVMKVPKTPKTSYNHHRFISDLLRQQVNHFHAIEKDVLPTGGKLTDISKIKTELHASKYLKKMTALLHPEGSDEPQSSKKTVTHKKTTSSTKRKSSAGKKLQKRKRR